MKRITFYLPNLGVYGGIQSSIMMADAMQRMGHEVSVVYPVIPGRDGLPWWNIRKWLVQIVRTFQNLLFKPRWFDFSGTLVAIPWSSETFLPRSDVLVLTWWADVEKLGHCNSEKGRVIHFVRSYETWGGPEERVRAVYRSSIDKVATSRQLAAQLEADGRSPLAVIPNGLNPVFFEEFEKAEENHQKIHIGMLYRVQDWKRLSDGFKALEKIKVPYKLILFGEQPKLEDREALSRIEDVETNLLPTGADLRDLYRGLDIFLFTSDETEAFGNPPLEAMASGCAVVSTRVGAVTQYAENEVNILLVEPRDIDAMAQSLERLIGDPQLRQKLGSEARSKSEEFKWSDSARQFDELLDELF